MIVIDSMLKRVAFYLFLGLISIGTGCRFTATEPISTRSSELVDTTTAVSPLPSVTTSPPSPLPTTTSSLVPVTPTTRPTATATTPVDLSLYLSEVQLYPAPQLYAGDQVTIQASPYVPNTINPNDVTITVFVDGLEMESGVLNERDIAGNAFGLLKWVWDTTDLAGQHQIQIVLDQNDTIAIGDENPDNNHVTFYVSVNERDLLPEAEANAAWVTADTDCCHVHVVSGTAAYRDLPQLLVAVETAVQQATARLDESPNQPIDITFINRIIGQGGYAGSSLVISYPDRDYAHIALHQVIVHETVHILDRQFAPQRIPLLAEGLAVWASDGHYKPENIPQQAAALLELDLALPLAELADDFYRVQHEIGYLQAASFVDYLIDKYGWSQFRRFYQDVTYDESRAPSESLAMQMQIHYNKTLAEMEADWLAHLESLPWDETAVTDLQTTISLYNAMRRYQQLYDPTAYYLNAWLPYPEQVRENGNPADLTRRPQTELNITLEIMLQAAVQSLQDGDYGHANVTLDSIERVLNNNGLFQDPLALNYKNIVHLLTNNSYDPQQIDLSTNHATVWVTAPQSNDLTPLNLILEDQNWQLIR